MINFLFTAAALLISFCSAEPKTPPVYNGDLEYYIADLSSGYPCSPYFNSEITWFSPDAEGNTYRGIRDMLNGLSDVGFNAIKLPLFPVSDDIKGVLEVSSIGGNTEEWSRDQCNQISSTIIDVMRNHTLSRPNQDNESFFDDKYHYFKVYWAPMYDARQYQSKMSEFEYASWILEFILDNTKIVDHDWLSVFSANPTTLELEPEVSAINIDRVSLYEMEVYKIIKSTMNRYIEKNKDIENPQCTNIKEFIFDTDAAEGVPENPTSDSSNSTCVPSGTNNCDGQEASTNTADSEQDQETNLLGIDTNTNSPVDVNQTYFRTAFCADDSTIEVPGVSPDEKLQYCQYKKCPPEPLHKAHILPKLIGPDKATVLHTQNILKTFDGSSITRPDYLENLDIIGTHSMASDLTSSADGYKNLNEVIKDKGKDLWLTSSAQEWVRYSPVIESDSFSWAPEQRLRQEHQKLQRINDQNINLFWANYLETPPTTTPLSLAIEAGVKAITIWNAIPRMINNAGDPNLNNNWSEGDKIVDTNDFDKSYNKTVNMMHRNWTTPYQVRESLNQRRYEKPCVRWVEEGLYSYKLPGYDTCVIRLDKHEIEEQLARNPSQTTNIPLYIDHTRSIYSWTETCDKATRKCGWEPIQVGIDLKVDLTQPETMVTYLFESDVPYDSDFIFKFGGDAEF